MGLGLTERSPDEIDEELLDDVDDFLQSLSDDDLTEWEREFVDSIIEKLERYESRTRVSERQWDVIDRLRNRLG